MTVMKSHWKDFSRISKASRYLFCSSFFGEDVIVNEIFVGPFAVIEEHMTAMMPNCFDAIGLLLMIHLTYKHQLIMSKRRVPFLDSYFDKCELMKLVGNGMVAAHYLIPGVYALLMPTLWEDDVHPHYITRSYAEFAGSLLHLNVNYRDGQQKQQTIFLINNYDLVLSVLKEAGIDGGKTQQQFEELLKSSSTVFVEELCEHFMPHPICEDLCRGGCSRVKQCTAY